MKSTHASRTNDICVLPPWLLGFTVDVGKRRTGVSFFHFLKFVKNFLKGVVLICLSFRSTGQPGRINGFDRCFQVVDRYTARRHRVTPVLAKTQILKFYSPIWGTKSPSRELLSPVWELLNIFGGLLTLFDDTLKQVLGLPTVKFESITRDELDDKFLSLPEVSITYNKAKIVQNIDKKPQ